MDNPKPNLWMWAVVGAIAGIALVVTLNNTGLLRKLADAVFAGV